VVVRAGAPTRPAMESTASGSSARMNFDPFPAAPVRRVGPQGRGGLLPCSDHRSGGCHRPPHVVDGVLAGKAGTILTPSGTCLNPGGRLGETTVTHAAA